jgi:hypothetical protein
MKRPFDVPQPKISADLPKKKRAKKTVATTRPLVIGWRERIDLPELGYFNLPAKIDTGARTSALHAEEILTFSRDGERWVRFRVPGARRSLDRVHECRVRDAREIRNTSGVPEVRVVIRTSFVLADREWKIDISLTDRSGMKHELIVGRSAIADHAIAVHSGRSYLTRRKPKA